MYNLFILSSVLYIFIWNLMFELICVRTSHIHIAHYYLINISQYPLPTGRCKWIYDIKFTSLFVWFVFSFLDYFEMCWEYITFNPFNILLGDNWLNWSTSKNKTTNIVLYVLYYIITLKPNINSLTDNIEVCAFKL